MISQTIRDNLNWSFSALLAVAVHAGVAFLIMQNWDASDPLELTEIQPYYIEAGLVSKNPYETAKQERAEQERQRRAESIRRQRAAQAQEEREKQLALERQRLDEERMAAEAAERARQETRERLALPQIEAEANQDDPAVSDADRAEMEATLADAIMQEQAYRKAVTDDEKAMAYVAQIQREIIQNWSRPPSARNGMQAILRVFLVPTGEVVNVVVEESSGNDAFDRSAVLAVRKAERFQVPQDSSQFERNFREFTVLFRPEDLRL